MKEMSTCHFLGPLHGLQEDRTIVEGFKDCVEPFLPVNGIQHNLRLLVTVWRLWAFQKTWSSRYNLGLSYSIQMAFKKTPCSLSGACSMYVLEFRGFRVQ
ncbi:hypothetical protein NPIL_656861 [Nephila pilipes]|uniref:Uncharacterized protein n=1 Tax=Nephila pilipes TaxID=299642 RepID=A0A8X6JNS1_NEPPI|nr:hypothetical protein NPIL_656861 [Nephila pilipes]